jgi:ABC-type multidrug transport system fused ATPase/permease subunit
MGMRWGGPMGGPEPVKLSTPMWPLLKRMGGLLGQQRRFLMVSMGCVSVASGLQMVPPYLTKLTVDHYIRIGDKNPLVWIVVGLAFLHAVRYALTYVNRYALALASQQLVYRMAKDLYERLQGLSLRFYERTGAGEIISRVTNDVNTLQNSLNGGVINAAVGLVSCASYGVVLFLLGWDMALLVFTTLPALIVASAFSSGLLRTRYKKVQEKIAGVNAVLAENITGVRVSKAFAKEGEQMGQFRERNQDNMKANMNTAVVQALATPMIQMITTLGICIVLIYGSYRVFNGQMTVGTMVAFLSYLTAFYGPVNELITVNNTLQQGLAAAERIFQFMDEHNEIEEDTNAFAFGRVRGHVRLDHVTFGYDAASPVLKDICIEAKPGEMIALVGHTGSGKTTIINLIPRFYDPDAGTITLDGHDIRHVTLRSLRDQLAIVLQETFLFNTTIAENIRYGRLEATDDEVIAAAKQAFAHDFIMNLPGGYEAQAGEAGSRISRGQRQRIALARAILKDPRILILDEATSDVDTETEVLIQQALDRVMRGRTVFVIAHRLSTIRNADRIVVLDHGVILEQGSHQELLARGGAYRQLYDIQFATQEAVLAAAG